MIGHISVTAKSVPQSFAQSPAEREQDQQARRASPVRTDGAHLASHAPAHAGSFIRAKGRGKPSLPRPQTKNYWTVEMDPQVVW
jgi:hypothetical protein